MKENKGITLIALVITIIVMLILVAVTITMAINGGLFGYAQNAAGGTKNAYISEQQIGENGTVTVDNEEYASIDDYIDSLNREKYGIREDGKFYCDPASTINATDQERIFTGLVYDSEHFTVTDRPWSGLPETVVYVWEDSDPYSQDIFSLDGEFLAPYWSD